MYVYPAMCFRRDRITGNEQKQVNGTWNAVKHSECVTKQELFGIGIHNTRMPSFSTTVSSTGSKQTSLSFWPMEERLRWFQASHFFWGQPQLQHSLSQPRILRTSGEYIHHFLGNPHHFPWCQQVICFKSCWCWFPSCALRATPSTLKGMFGASRGGFLEASHAFDLPGMQIKIIHVPPSLAWGWHHMPKKGLQDGGEIVVVEEFLNPTGWTHLSWCPKWSLRLETRWSIPGVQPTSAASIVAICCLAWVILIPTTWSGCVSQVCPARQSEFNGMVLFESQMNVVSAPTPQRHLAYFNRSGSQVLMMPPCGGKIM